MVRVYLIDDHEVVRRGIAELLTEEGDIEIVGESGSAVEAVHRIPRCTLTSRFSTPDRPTAVRRAG